MPASRLGFLVNSSNKCTFSHRRPTDGRKDGDGEEQRSREGPLPRGSILDVQRFALRAVVRRLQENHVAKPIQLRFE